MTCIICLVFALPVTGTLSFRLKPITGICLSIQNFDPPTSNFQIMSLETESNLVKKDLIFGNLHNHVNQTHKGKRTKWSVCQFTTDRWTNFYNS